MTADRFSTDRLYRLVFTSRLFFYRVRYSNSTSVRVFPATSPVPVCRWSSVQNLLPCLFEPNSAAGPLRLGSAFPSTATNLLTTLRRSGEERYAPTRACQTERWQEAIILPLWALPAFSFA